MDDIWQFLKTYWFLVLPAFVVVAALIAGAILRIRAVTSGHPWYWLRAKLGWGKKVEELARRLGVDRDQLRAWEPSYREAFIAKKRGGQRRLLIPDPALKDLQRRLLRRLLRHLRAHPAACGFERGKSVLDNARPHLKKPVVIKMDIVDFFPSITSARVEGYFRRVGWNKEAALLLTRLCTHDGGLPQGAPTSPRLSNLLHHGFDAKLTRRVERHMGSYTRYADDITISLPTDRGRRVRGVIQYTRRLAKAYGLTIHVKGKLRVLRRHQRQKVTGLVVNEQLHLPRKVRRWLRAVEHRLRTKGQATLSGPQLQGWRAWRRMVQAGSAAAMKRDEPA